MYVNYTINRAGLTAMNHPDDDDVLEDDPELPDETDFDDDDEPDVIPCPYCRQFISEDAERCHHCGSYISAEEAPASNRSIVITIVVGALVLAAIVGWLVGR